MAHDDDPGGWLAESESYPELNRKNRDPESEEHEKIRDEALKRFDLVNEVESTQREREFDDLYFDGISQWSAESIRERKGTKGETGQYIPPRPILEIDLIDPALQQISGEARNAKLALKFRPDGDEDVTAADQLQGQARRIQITSHAAEARHWALDRAMRCGRGYYLIDTDFANDDDFETLGAFDLDIVYRRILDQSSVYFDPFAERADMGDADWAMLVTWVSKDEHKRRWPTAERPAFGTDAWTSLLGTSDPWVKTTAGDSESYRVAQYFRVEYSSKALGYSKETGLVSLGEDRDDDDEQRKKFTHYRVVRERKVRRYFLDASQVLEEEDFPCRWIPIIPILGKEYNVNGERLWKGVVTKSKDAQRAFNVARSAEVEAAALATKANFVMAEGQDRGYEDMWDTANTKNWSRLIYNPVSLDGVPVPPPQRAQAEPAIQHLIVLSNAAREDVQSTTSRHDPSLGKVSSAQRSGKAIERLQAQGVASTSNYLDNMALISMPHEGEILLDMIPKVYDRPGRIVRIVGEEDDDESAVLLKVPFTRDEKNRPVPAPCPHCGGIGFHQQLDQQITCPACQGSGVAPRELAPDAEYVDFAEGKYRVTVTVGKSQQTRREESMTAMAELASAAPDLVQIYSDLWVRSMDFAGSQEIADRLQAANPHAQTAEKMGSVPKEARAIVGQMQQQMSQMQQQLQEAQQQIQTDATKVQGMLQSKQMEVQGRLAAQQMEAQVELQAKQLELSHKEAMAKFEAAGEMRLAMVEQQGGAEADARKAELESMLVDLETASKIAVERVRQHGAMQIEMLRQEAGLKKAALGAATTIASKRPEADVVAVEEPSR